MRRVSRKFKRHFGVSAAQVRVRSQRVWYWQVLNGLAFILIGYLVAYWHLTGGDFGSLTNGMMRMTQQNQQLQAKSVQLLSQLQVAQAAQATLAKELSSMQDESIRLKEDVTFYKNILNDSADELKLYSFNVVKTSQPKHYDYHILLIQSGRHDKPVQGSLNLVLNAIQSSQAVKLPLNDGTTTTPLININFKYYQRIDGTFVVPDDVEGHSLELAVTETSQANRAQTNKARINQKIDLPV